MPKSSVGPSAAERCWVVRYGSTDSYVWCPGGGCSEPSPLARATRFSRAEAEARFGVEVFFPLAGTPGGCWFKAEPVQEVENA